MNNEIKIRKSILRMLENRFDITCEFNELIRMVIIKRLHKIILFLFIMLISNSVFSQPLDTKGKDFWFAYLPNYHNNIRNTNPLQKYGDSIYVYVVADVPTNGTFFYKSRIGTQFQKDFSITDPSVIYIFRLEHSEFELLGCNNSGILGDRNQSEVIAPNSFHLVTDNDVTVYAHDQASTTSEAFNVLPTDAIGTEYMVLAYNSDDRNKQQAGIRAETPSQFAIVGTVDGTQVTINPSSPTMYNGMNQKKINLNAGEVYLVQSRISDTLNYDLTSSEIFSDKPVAVFAGQQRASVPYFYSGSRDCLIEQMLPIQSWGSNALLIPFFQHPSINSIGYYDIYRVLAAYDDTKVYINDTLMIKKNRGEFIERDLILPEKVLSNKPVYVMSYKKTSGDGGGNAYSDPLMMTIPQVEQFNNFYRFINIQAWENNNKVYTEQYLGLVAPNSALGKITLDSLNLPSNIFIPIPFSKYSYTIIQKMSDGTHTVSCPEKFGIYVYGYGLANSYGYLSGMNMIRLDILPKLSTNSPLCEGDDLLLFADSIFNAIYYWSGPNGFKSNQQNPIIKNAKSNHSGKYSVYTSVGSLVSDTASISIIVNSTLISPGDSSLIFIGSAVKSDDYIKMTYAKQFDGGAIWLKNRFSIKQDFSTTFKFRVKYGNNGGMDKESIPGADGIAFVMQNHNYPFLGKKGGSMGYTEITNSLAIEFDLYKNEWDPNGNHIAVQSMGSLPNQPDHTINGSCLGINDKIITIQQDSVYYAKIEYDWIAKSLKVYIDSTGQWISPSLTVPNIDLATYLQLEAGEYVYIGFTSGTGAAYQEHDIFDWNLPCKNQQVSVEESIIDNKSTDKLSIYPNPANDKLTIECNTSDESVFTLRIINALGQEIKKIDVNKLDSKVILKQEIDISKFSEGLYLVILQTENQNYIRKFIVRR